MLCCIYEMAAGPAYWNIDLEGLSSNVTQCIYQRFNMLTLTQHYIIMPLTKVTSQEILLLFQGFGKTAPLSAFVSGSQACTCYFSGSKDHQHSSAGKSMTDKHMMAVLNDSVQNPSVTVIEICTRIVTTCISHTIAFATARPCLRLFCQKCFVISM